MAVLVLSSGLMLSACALSRVPTTGEKELTAWTWEEERAIGAQADEQIQAMFGVYDDNDLTNYVNRVGQDIVEESHLRDPDTAPEIRSSPVVFRVLDSPVVNAFALPGGYVYLTRGLLAHLNNEAQMAVVLAHEVGHVAARHSAQRAADQQLGQFGLLAGAILGSQLGLPGGTILDIGRTALPLLFLSYSRGDEREADEFGVGYAAQAGYEAEEGAEFFESLDRIQDKEGQSLPGWLSTHPDPGDREQTIVQLAQEWEQRAQMTEVGQDAYYRHIDNIVLGEDPRKGFTEGGVFYHPQLEFRYPVPSGWRVINQASQVIMLESNQQAVMTLRITTEGSAGEAAQAFAQQQGLQILDSGRTESNGYPAAYVYAAAQTQQGANLRMLAYFIEFGGEVYYFLGYTSAQLFSRYEDNFLRSMQGFDRVTDRDILTREPSRIDIGTVRNADDFRSFVDAGDLPMDMDAEEMAILNQLTLGTRVQAGTELKLAQQ